MESTTDVIIALVAGAASIGWLYFIGWVDAKREMKRNRKEVQRGANNYARMKARMVVSSEVIRKGHE